MCDSCVHQSVAVCVFKVFGKNKLVVVLVKIRIDDRIGGSPAVEGQTDPVGIFRSVNRFRVKVLNACLAVFRLDLIRAALSRNSQPYVFSGRNCDRSREAQFDRENRCVLFFRADIAGFLRNVICTGKLNGLFAFSRNSEGKKRRYHREQSHKHRKNNRKSFFHRCILLIIVYRELSVFLFLLPGDNGHNHHRSNNDRKNYYDNQVWEAALLIVSRWLCGLSRGFSGLSA